MRKNVLHQLFDIRPTTTSGEVDVERINRVTRFATVDLRGKRKVLPQNPAEAVIQSELPPEVFPRQAILAASYPRPVSPSAVFVEGESLPEATPEPVIPERDVLNGLVAKRELLQTLVYLNEKDRVSWVGLARAPLNPPPTVEERVRQPGQPQRPTGVAPTTRERTRKRVSPQEWRRRPNEVKGGRVSPQEWRRRPEVRSEQPKEKPRLAEPPEKTSSTQKLESEPVMSVLNRAVPIREQERVLEGIFSPGVSVSPKLFPAEPAPHRNRGRRGIRLKTILIAVGVLVVFVGGLGIFGRITSHVQSFVRQGGDVFAGIEEGFASFEKRDWKRALRAFRQAKRGFKVLSEELEQSGVASVAFAKGEEKINTGRSFISIGKEASEIGSLLAQTAELMSNPDLLKGVIAMNGAAQGLPSHAKLFESMATAENHAAEAARHLDTLKASVAGVEPATIPPEYREKFFLLADKLPQLETALNETRTLLSLFRHALGEDGSRQYLILLENSSELRATGGFPGTYGLAEFRGGRLTKFFFDGIYNPDGQLNIRVAPPKALQRVSPFWGMRDAGWFFHFPTSAKKFAWFYEQAGGPRVDGVIAVTPQFVERLLGLTGAFSMPEYGQSVIDKHNFIEVLQFEVEDDFDPKLGNPKKILTDLAPKVLERLAGFHGEKLESLFDVFETSLHEKDIQVFSFNENLQEFVETKRWGGEMAEQAPDQDYLAVVHTNVAGGKADWVTDDELLQEISIAEDGAVMKTVSLTRRHKGGKTPYVWWNAENKDYLRLLVPRGTDLLAADGLSERDSFSRTPRDKAIVKDPDILAMESGLKHEARYKVDLFQERDKDVIAGWLMIPPGESRRATFRYRLPERFDPQDRFVVHVQKQAGLKPYPVTTRILFPASWRVDHQPEGATLKPGFLEITQPFRQDLHYDIGFTR